MSVWARASHYLNLKPKTSKTSQISKISETSKNAKMEGGFEHWCSHSKSFCNLQKNKPGKGEAGKGG